MTDDTIQARVDRLESLVEQQQTIIEEQGTIIEEQGERLDQLDAAETPGGSTEQRETDTAAGGTPELLTAGGQPTKVIGSIADDNGIGVHGEATGSGTTYGIRGDATSTDGYGLFTPDDTRLDGALVGSSLTQNDAVTSLRGTGLGLDSGELTTAYVQDGEPPVGPAGTFWVNPVFSSLDSYDDGASIYATAYGDDGYVYAGGTNDLVYKLDPADLTGGPIDYYSDGSSIYAIAYGTDGYVYAGGQSNEVHKLDPTDLSGGPVDPTTTVGRLRPSCTAPTATSTLAA